LPHKGQYQSLNLSAKTHFDQKLCTCTGG